ncbi:O-antigen ligase family protein [Winogradskyella litoriviva]|uniref:O-antigen ligase family protein n=1 Tax=Winogradskyella litoriviva TaxID=1220182 RepID=A0ABX2E5F5_9FLAO|nr:O-antigen ligase family protein [Winogradskyella litoriviva]NRD23522.1 O-antigen ligase family protein [Winogradskyella litoriviva]
MVAILNYDSEFILIGLVKCFSYIVFSFLFYLIAKENIKFVNIIIGVHVLICVFAILQHPLSPISSSMMAIKKTLFASIEASEGIAKKLNNQEEYIKLGIGIRFRASGPFPSAITFSYFLLSTFFLNIYMYFRQKKGVYLGIISLILVCSFLTQTRSLILAEFFILLGVFVFIHNEKLNSYKVIFTLIGLIASLVFINKIESFFTGNKDSRLTKLDDEGSHRDLLWLTGLYAVATHPLGITSEEYAEVRREMFYKFGKEAVLVLPSHNGFVNVGFNYTIFGYPVIILFFIFLFKHIKMHISTYKILFTLYVTGYIIHSMFHNNFLFYSDYDVYMVIMLIPIYSYIDKNDNESFIRKKLMMYE